MRIDYTKGFIKDLKAQPVKIQEKFRIRTILFGQNKFNPMLHNHALIGEYEGFRSINITGDLRAIFQDYGDTVVFTCLGTHSQLYG
jgi:addiction module RelE/StbE family toxin